MKITDQAHRAEMTARRSRQMARTSSTVGTRFYPLGATAIWKGDGFDRGRLQRAELKRARRAAARSVRAA